MNANLVVFLDKDLKEQNEAALASMTATNKKVDKMSASHDEPENNKRDLLIAQLLTQSKFLSLNCSLSSFFRYEEFYLILREDRTSNFHPLAIFYIVYCGIF